MTRRPLTWGQRFDFAALTGWLAGSLFMAYSALVFFGQDLRGFYAAAVVLRQGGDVYDFPTVFAAMQSATGLVTSNLYYYPPWLAMAFVPLALLPFPAARVVWMVINLLAWCLGLFVLTRALGWPRVKAPVERWLIYFMATYLFAWLTWRYEQLGVVLFLLLALALGAIESGREAWGGVCLALLLTKPSITGPIVAALLLWLALRRRWPALVGFGAAGAALAAISLPFVPGLLAHFRDPQFLRGINYAFNADGTIQAVRINTTLKDWLNGYHLSGSMQTGTYLLVAVAGLLGLGWVVWRSPSPWPVAAVGALVALCLATYALQYDYPPLTLTLFFGLRELARRPPAVRWAGAVLILGVLSVPFWERPISDGFWIVIGLTGLLALLALSRRPLFAPRPAQPGRSAVREEARAEAAASR
jgi:hypothetical protein